MIKIDLDYDYCENILKKAEYINDCLVKKTPPESCEEMGLCEHCDLQHICGQVKRVPTDIEMDDELENLINRKEELKAAKAEYESVDKAIKDRIGEREKVITGTYLIERKSFVKKAFTVPESTQWRINIKRL